MHTFYDIVTGPLLWISFILFFAGLAYRLIYGFIKARQSDPFVMEYWSWKHALNSMLHWLTPFGVMRWRTKPLLTVVTFAFHISVLVVPLFLMGHLVLLDQWTGLSWPALPAGLADALTVVVIVAVGYFAFRRITASEVRFVTRPDDWLILAIIAGTFLTGFLAYHQWGGYLLMISLHILFGEAFLIMVPFTRVYHMILWPFSRGYIGSEFGAVRKTRDW